MSWLITPSFYGFIADADAKDYLARVHAAEGQTLEPAVALAIETFIVGCKADGIWNAIKASCILAGARTLAGALVPLVGAAPTNFNFVSGDYGRKTGLVGDGSTKYLDSNRNNNADPQDSNHNAVYVSTAHAQGTIGSYISSASTNTGTNNLLRAGSAPFDITVRSRSSNAEANIGSGAASGLLAVSRDSSSQFSLRSGGSTTTHSRASDDPFNGNLFVFARGNSTHVNARLAFYSIGESLDLALLDARVTALINAFDAAI
jgi:hypothetical protein